MKTSDFMYDLPEELIAQTPVEPRDHSRMMVIPMGGEEIQHRHFYDVVDYLKPGDALVINETRVIPARLLGERENGGPAEILLLTFIVRRSQPLITWRSSAFMTRALREPKPLQKKEISVFSQLSRSFFPRMRTL